MKDANPTIRCQCGGWFVDTGKVLYTAPAKYKYACGRCGHETTLSKTLHKLIKTGKVNEEE